MEHADFKPSDERMLGPLLPAAFRIDEPTCDLRSSRGSQDLPEDPTSEPPLIILVALRYAVEAQTFIQAMRRRHGGL